MWNSKPFFRIPTVIGGVFYGVLCVFSIVTGLMYALGKRELNPLELSDSFVRKLDTEEKKTAFARKMGVVTFLVGIAQGITAAAMIFHANSLGYAIALGFTLFSIASVLYKLKGKVNAFPALKLAAYLAIITVLIFGKA
ncbi:MAG: hypothetical protein II510_06315 [Erysipelotrichales bacterium]|nr:hypothetical protein [Erysipelotrichales bacterium]